MIDGLEKHSDECILRLMQQAMIDDQKQINGGVKRDRFMDALFRKEPIKLPREGDVVEATVISKEGTHVFADLGFATGVIFGREYHLGKQMLKKVNPGDIISAKVVDYENEDGYVELSVSEADKDRAWKELKELKDTKKILQLKAIEANKGGLVFDWNGLKGFLPVSQLTSQHYPRVEGGDKSRILEELQKFVEEEFSLVVLDYDQRDEKLIFSEKGGTPDEVQKQIERYTVGEIIEGEVSGIVEFGVFVKLEDSLEGLVHISELDWSLVEDPNQKFTVGDTVKVKIIGIEGDKISLSIKALKEDPWKVAGYQKGDIVIGRVTKLSKIGAFVQVIDESKSEISGKIFGLSHVSEFGSLQKMESEVKVDQNYPFQIALYDSEQHKLSLLFLGDESQQAVNQPKKSTSETIEEAKEDDAGSNKK